MSAGRTLIIVGAVVSDAGLLLSSDAQETISKVGTRLTARVRMHQVNRDFRFFLLIGGLSLLGNYVLASATGSCQACSKKFARNHLG